MGKIQRRSREELEALAREFGAVPDRTGTVPKWVWAACAVVLALLAAWEFWPEAEAPREKIATPVASDASQWRQRYEAERERRRKEQRASGDYLERSAAAESALLKDMAASAQRLTEAASRAAEAPAPRTRGEAAPKPETPGKKSEPAVASAASPGPATAAPSGHAAAEPAPSPAATAAPAAPAATTSVAQADASQCRINVSELSASGKLTFADIVKMKGAHVDERTGHVLTPSIPVQGRWVVFNVAPNGCVSIVPGLKR